MVHFYSLKSNNGKRSPYSVLYVLLSFFVPTLIMVLALIALHITPFGEHNLAITDAKFYLNMELFFSRLLKGQENILYSFNNGLGGNEWSQFAWGGFNFGSLLSVFAVLETIPFIFTWICAFNLALCGLTMYLLLAGISGHKVSHLIFSTSYAFIGFNVVNVYQIGFVLGPELLPLVALGLILMFRGKKPILYILSLGFCAFFDFYFAFHICVFSFLFFLAFLYVKSEELNGVKKRFFLQWFISSVIGGFLGAAMWLPTLKAYTGGGRLDQTGVAEFTFNENMPFIQMFSKLFSGANSKNELVAGMPNIFCGILVLALVILFFMNKKIGSRCRRAVGIILIIYLLTFYIHAFTLIMHGGTHTNWFPYRYSYVFSFIFICLATEEFNYISCLSIKDIKQCGIVILIAALIVFSTSYEFISGSMVVLDFGLLLLMWTGFWFYRTKPGKGSINTLSMLLLILVGINMYVNFIVSTANVREWELDLKEYNEHVMVSGALTEALTMADNDFFRMEKDTSESDSVGADSYLYNYNGVSHSGPSERMFIHQGLCKLGINWFDMRHWYSKGIPAATDTLLGLKYLISEKDLTEEKNYEALIELAGYKAFKNPDALQVSILSDEKVDEIGLGEDAFDNLNVVWKGMTGKTKDIFTEQLDVTFSLVTDYSNQTVTSKELRESVSAVASESDSLMPGSLVSETDEANTSSYIFYTFEAAHDGPIYVFDTSIPSSENGLSTPAIKYVGSYKTGETVEGKFPITAGIATGDIMKGYCANMVFAYADNDLLSEYAKELNARDISFDVRHENDLVGTFTAEKGQRVLFTIPWDEGWTCYIDGKKVPIEKTWNLFMSVEAPEGEHTYEMKFFPAWLNYGLYISFASFIAFILFMVIWKKQKPRYDVVTEAKYEQEKQTIPGNISAIGLNPSECISTDAKENTK